MAQKLIEVPTIFQGAQREEEFRTSLAAALKQDCFVILDFQAHPAVSSLILGHILFHVKDLSNRVEFINVSNYMLDTLRTIMGPLANELVKGPIRDLDDSDVLDEV